MGLLNMLRRRWALEAEARALAKSMPGPTSNKAVIPVTADKVADPAPANLSQPVETEPGTIPPQRVQPRRNPKRKRKGRRT